jgi:hypothetical protein
MVDGSASCGGGENPFLAVEVVNNREGVGCLTPLKVGGEVNCTLHPFQVQCNIDFSRNQLAEPLFCAGLCRNVDMLWRLVTSICSCINIHTVKHRSLSSHKFHYPVRTCPQYRLSMTWGIVADQPGQRYILIVSLLLLMILSNILLSVSDIPKAALMFAFCISHAGAATTLVFIVSYLFIYIFY